ncbi:MAG TPA: glycosyltransferase [Planctomycetes bacterium]|nr:glycosyltransferase [Planctomycetota bacterium]
MTDLSFTVVICTKDRRADLGCCLDSLALRLAMAQVPWDVLVVDNASNDGTSDEVKARREDFGWPLEVIREERLGLAIARNTGLHHAQGEVLIFVDDDITFHEGWVEAWEDAFAEDALAAAGGPITPVFPESTPAWYKDGVMADGGTTTGTYNHGNEVLAYQPRRGVGHPRGGNMAVRKSLATALGGFREDLGWGKKRIPGEETDFFQRLWDTGVNIQYLPGPRVNHHLDAARMNIKYLCSWHIGYGRASILMRPPQDPVRWALKLAAQCFNIAFYTIRLALPRGSRNFRAHRKQRQSMGRFAQMVGL